MRRPVIATEPTLEQSASLQLFWHFWPVSGTFCVAARRFERVSSGSCSEQGGNVISHIPFAVIFASMQPPNPTPVLMRRDEVIRLDRAAFHAGRHPDTIRDWCRRYGIARQVSPNSPLEISAVALEMVLQGDHDALELLRAGQRGHPAVQRYLDHLGLTA